MTAELLSLSLWLQSLGDAVHQVYVKLGTRSVVQHCVTSGVLLPQILVYTQSRNIGFVNVLKQTMTSQTDYDSPGPHVFLFNNPEY